MTFRTEAEARAAASDAVLAERRKRGHCSRDWHYCTGADDTCKCDCPECTARRTGVPARVCPVCRPAPTRIVPKGSSGQTFDDMVIADHNRARQYAAHVLREKAAHLAQQDAEELLRPRTISPVPLLQSPGQARRTWIQELTRIADALEQPMPEAQ